MFIYHFKENVVAENRKVVSRLNAALIKKSLSENLRLAFIKQLTCVRLQFSFSHVQPYRDFVSLNRIFYSQNGLVSLN